MIDDHELFGRAVERFVPPEPAFERLAARRDRKHRNKRITAGIVALVIAVAGTGALVRAFPPGIVAADGPRGPFLGSWVATDANGSTQMMTVEASEDDAVEIEVHEDASSECSGAPSTMVGTGRPQGGTQLVIPAPTYTCDDGSEPESLSDPPLQEQLRDLTFVLDTGADALTDNFGGVWLREGAEDPSATDLEPVWPQTSLEEVRQAQELADAGDPRYTWQVDRDLEGQVGQHHPSDAEIFGRFLEEELGWEDFRW